MDREESIKKAGQINIEAIKRGFDLAEPGISLKEIEITIKNHINYRGGTPAFFNYKGFPGYCCLSVNNTVVHGIPNDYILQKGDVLTIDCGTQINSWNVDQAETKIIENGSFEDHKLVDYSQAVLEEILEIIKPSITLVDIWQASQNSASSKGINLFPTLGGHKIGQSIHEEPFISHGGPKPSIKKNYSLKEGDCICLEPICTFGSTNIQIEKDGWTIKSVDGSKSAHFEACILITKEGWKNCYE